MKKRMVSLLAAAAVTALLFAAIPMTTLAAGKGDFNNDGERNTTDVRSMMSMVVGADTPTQQQLWWGDYNINDAIDTTDARTLLTDILYDTDLQAINYAAPTGEDCWGERSVAVLGDSISFGVGASDPLPENTYVGYLKKAVQAANGGKLNYGFESSYPTSWQPDNRADGIHMFPTRSSRQDADGNWVTDWVCDGIDEGNRLISVAMISTAPWSLLTFTLREAYVDSYDYFCVYYHTEPDAGYFCVADGVGGEIADVNGSKNYIGTANTVEETKRTAFYRLSDCPTDENGLPQIIICHDGSTNPVTITGIGYYSDISGETVTVNGYTRGGMKLSDLSDTVLSQAASSDTLVLALGYNDAHFNYNAATFTDRIDYLIKVCNENDTNVIVNNVCWKDAVNETIVANIEHVHSELRRLAAATGGVYVDQQVVLGQAIWDDLAAGDGVHPTSAGQRLLAQTIVNAMGLTWTEEWL